VASDGGKEGEGTGEESSGEEEEEGGGEEESWAKGSAKGFKGKRKRGRMSSGEASLAKSGALADSGPEAWRHTVASPAQEQKPPSGRGALSASASGAGQPGAPGAAGAVSAISKGGSSRRGGSLAWPPKRGSRRCLRGGLLGAPGAVPLAGASTHSSSSSSSSTLAATESGAAHPLPTLPLALGLALGLASGCPARPAPASAPDPAAGAVLGPNGEAQALAPAPPLVLDEWVECESCETWRLLPPPRKADEYESVHFVCKMMDWM